MKNYSNISWVDIKGKSMYFFDNNRQCVSAMDLNRNEFHIIKFYKGPYIMISQVFMCEDCLYMVSWHSNKIIVYDFITSMFTAYRWDDTERQFVYRNHFLYDNKIWFVPGNYKDDLIYFDLWGKKFIRFKEYKEKMQEYQMSLVISDIDVKSGVIWGIEFDTNKMFCFDINTKEMKFRKLKYAKGFAHICVDHGNLWVTLVYGRTVLHVTEYGDIEEIRYKMDQDDLQCYSDIALIDRGVILLPRFLNEICILKNQGKEVGIFDLCETALEIEGIDTISKIVAVAEDKDKIYLPPFGNEKFLIIDKKNNCLLQIPLEYDRLSVLKYYFNKCPLMRETESNDLIDFAEFILEYKREMDKYNDSGIVGKDIHETLLEN